MSDQPELGADVAPEQSSPEPTTTPPATTQQESPKPDSSSAPEGFVELKRFTGAIQKIQSLTDEVRSKEQETAALNSQIEQLRQQQAVKDAEVQAGYGERDQKLEAALKEKQEIEAQTALLQGKLKKIDLAKELGHPELISIIDTIPTFDDPDLQKKAMEDILSFSEERVKAREESLLAGITPAVSSTQVSEILPTTDEGWREKVNSEPDPQKRQILFDKWWDWQQKGITKK